jgi:hypothetical protein
MTNETDNTALTVIIPEVWQKRIVSAIYDGGKVINRVDNVSGEVSRMGDILHLPNFPTLSVNSVGASGSVVNQTVTLTENQLTVDQHKEVTMTLTDKASKQAHSDIVSDFYMGAGDLLRQQIDADILALATDANFAAQTAQGDGSQPLDEDALAGAIGVMMNSKFAEALDQADRATFFLHSGEWRNLKKIGVYSHASLLGSSKAAADKIALPSFYGVGTVMHTQVRVASSIRYNLLALKESLAVAIQSNPDVIELPRADLARRFNVNVLYGVKTRIDRGVLLKSINA